MESFENIYDDHKWLTHILQDTFILTYKKTNELILHKLNLILEILNLQENKKENFLNRFRSLFQEYFQLIFLFTDDFFNDLKKDLHSFVDEKYKECERIKDIKEDVNSKYFKILIATLFKLCIYMILHDPLINLNIKPFEERKIEYHFFNKNSFITVEGFGKEKTPCAILLNPPTFKNNFIFQGIKPAVYCLTASNEEILKDCEENEKIKNSLKETKEKNETEINNNTNNNKKSDNSLNIVVEEEKISVQQNNSHSKINFKSEPSEVKIDCFDHPLKRDSITNNNITTTNNNLTTSNNCLSEPQQQSTNCNQTTDARKVTIQQTAIEKEYLNFIAESTQKRANYRSNSELMKNENSILMENDNSVNKSYLSTENNKPEKENNKTLDKLMYTSNFETNANNLDNSPDIAVLIKKKNTNFANNFLDSFNKNNNLQLKQALQNKTKHNSTHSSSLKINPKIQKNNYFQSNRERSAFHTKQPLLSQDYNKKKGNFLLKILDVNVKFFDQKRQNTLHSPELTNENQKNFTKLNSVFVGKEQGGNNNFFTKTANEKALTNSPKILNNFMKMKSVMTMKNSIKNAYIEYINSKALNKNLNQNLNSNMNKKLNLNSSNPNANPTQNNVFFQTNRNTIKDNPHTLNIHIPVTNNRNEKNMLTKNLTDKTSSKHENNINDNEYVQLNSENFIEYSNRNLYELCSKTPVETATCFDRNNEMRYSVGIKREKEAFYQTNQNNVLNVSRRDSLKENNLSSNNSMSENYQKKEKKSPKSELKPNFFSNNHNQETYTIAHREKKQFEPSKTVKPMMFKNLQKNLKKSNKVII